MNLPEYLREVADAHREFRQQLEQAAEGLDKRLSAAHDQFHQDDQTKAIEVDRR